MNFIRPIFAFSLIPLGILVSLSVSFTNILAPPSKEQNFDESEQLSSSSDKVSSFQTIGSINLDKL